MAKRKAPTDLDDVTPAKVTTTGPPDLDRQDSREPTALGSAAQSPDDNAVRTLHQSRVWAFAAVKSGVQLWHGLCLRFVRECFNVDSLYPDAKTAWLEARRKHYTTTAADVPNGKATFWQVGDHWHVAYSIGRGRVISTDTDIEAPGSANVVLITAISSAWGARLLGYVDDLNGEAPVPAPKPRPRLSNREWRIRHVRQAITHARSSGQLQRAARLRDWLTDLRRRG